MGRSVVRRRSRPPPRLPLFYSSLSYQAPPLPEMLHNHNILAWILLDGRV